jgi:hypothetical protein
MKEESSYNEAWWERELHRNEKLMDRYLAALADNPDLTRLRKREEGPELRQMDSQTVEEDPAPAPGDSRAKEQLDEFFLEAGAAMEEAAEEIMDALEDDEEVVEPNPPNNEGYAELAAAARRFAVAIGSLEPCSEIPEILFFPRPRWARIWPGAMALGMRRRRYVAISSSAAGRSRTASFVGRCWSIWCNRPGAKSTAGWWRRASGCRDRSGSG